MVGVKQEQGDKRLERINGLIVLLLFQLAGESISLLSRVPIPGPVIGMLLLLFALWLRRRPVAALERTAETLLRHLALLFVPAGVGIVLYLELLQDSWLPIVTVIVLGTVSTLLATGWVLQWLLAKPWRRRL
ncbi:CidA/LrgA family protein [Ferrimonas pelagia]|uniref:CidA/LrgA family protein n=1 Tax=Ferrimonas pelagia TaxID=1177826 RepID=A0ABP9FKE0_9GAMM